MKKCWLDGKTFIITGASSGLGRGIAERLIVRHGCKVIGVGRSEKKFLDFSSALGDKANLLSYSLFDVTDKVAWQDFSNKIDFKIDGLINCAGVLPPFKKALNTSIEDVERVLQVDFLSCIYAINTLKHALLADSAIINVSSAAALCTIVGTSAYSSAKSALKSYTEALIYERPEAYVSLVMPGFARTDIFRSQNSAIDENKLFLMMSMPSDKMCEKIYKGIKRKRKRMILGKDAKLMNFFYKIMPKTTMLFISKILKKANVKLFDEVFKYR